MSSRPPVSRTPLYLVGVLVLIPLAVSALAAPSSTVEEPRWSTLILRNGREVQGEIVPPRHGLHPRITPQGNLIFVDEDGIPAERVDTTLIQFRSVDGTTMRYRQNMIQEIRLPEDQIEAEAEQIWERYRLLVSRGDFAGQLETAAQLYSLNSSDREIRQACWESEVATFREARRLTERGDIDEAFELWDALILHLDETGLRLVNPDPNVISDLGIEQEFNTAYVEALRRRVDSLIEIAVRNDPVDLQVLYRAHEYNQHLLTRAPLSLEGQLNQIEIQQLQGDLAGALALAEELRDNLPPGTSRQAEVAVDLRIETLQRELNPGSQTASAFPPSQQPTPSIGSTSPDNGRPRIPLPQVTAQPTPPSPSVQQPVQRPASSQVQAQGTYWTRLRRHVSDRNWQAAWTETQQAVEQAGPKVKVPLLILGALLVFWVIPYKIAKSRANRGSISASIWAPRIKIFGLLGMAFWMLSPMASVFARREKEQRDLCPHCGGDIGNVGLYRDFNFMACPHCNEAITPICDLQGYISHLIDDINRVRGGKSLGVEAMEGKIEREAMLRLVHATLTLAIRKRASDLHVDASDDGLDLRARIDGVLAALDIHVPRAIERAFVSAIKVMAELDITERRAPQDGRFSVMVDNEEIDIRINTSPTGMGEKISMRFLNPNDVRVPLEKLGITQQSMPAFRSAITSPHGLMLVTGPTGCGKSTTLYVALQEINNGTRNIVTLEDPIEYVFRGLNQHQVNPAANFTFATGLRSILRQDPDVIMVGEIRDRETADIAVDAATTGHLVMTTLHTIDAAGAYQRLAELGIDPRRSAPSLLLIIAQRLIRLTCTGCKEEYKPDHTAMTQLGLETVAKDMIFHRGAGCPKCDGLGHRGRIGLFEMMVINDELRFLMEGNTPVAGLREAARRAGMHTLREEGIARIMEGVSTPEEVLRVIT